MTKQTYVMEDINGYIQKEEGITLGDYDIFVLLSGKYLKFIDLLTMELLKDQKGNGLRAKKVVAWKDCIKSNDYTKAVELIKSNWDKEDNEFIEGFTSSAFLESRKYFVSTAEKSVELMAEKLDFSLCKMTSKGDRIFRDEKAVEELAVYEQNGKMLYTRKSPSDSKAQPEDAFIGKSAEMLFLAPKSSGFFDTAFLRALQTAKDEGLQEVEVCSYGTRTPEETATRSIKIAQIAVNFARRNNLEVVVNGIDLRGINGELFVFLVGMMAETKSVQNSHTKYAKKHDLYLEVLSSDNWEVLTIEQERELLSLIRYNGSQDKAISFMKNLHRVAEKRKATK